jgi:hypothetical protein
MRNFSELKEQEVLALAIALEEEDERTYDDYAHSLLRAAFQVVVGGVLVFLTGVLIGGAG